MDGTDESVGDSVVGNVEVGDAVKVVKVGEGVVEYAESEDVGVGDIVNEVDSAAGVVVFVAERGENDTVELIEGSVSDFVLGCDADEAAEGASEGVVKSVPGVIDVEI